MIILIILGSLVDATVLADDRPNILFCMADDWGWPHAGAYGDAAVATPAFDRIAREGVLFRRAFVTSPSCTPSRNSLITGKYHWQLGPGANLHSTLPAEHNSFIHMLRDRGYVTGHSPAKTWGPGRIQSWQAHHGDHPATGKYNSFEDFLDRRKTPSQPFFFWLASNDPHRGYKKGSGVRSGIDLKTVKPFPHFPDVTEIRSDIADYYFEVQRWDRLVAKALETLESRQLLDNTIIVVTGDHGMPFPRCKSNLYDCGVRVPLAVRWGKECPAGREILDFVSFVDIGPTLLEVARVPPDSAMDGQSFLSLLTSEKSGRLAPNDRPDIVFGKERHVPSQEKPDRGGYPSRGLRTDEYLFIQNFRPDRWPAGSPNLGRTNYPSQWLADCDGGPTKTYIYLNRDKDDQHRRSFNLCFAKRPAVELYDLAVDPSQLNNVAADPKYVNVVQRLQSRLQHRLTETHDPRATDPTFTGFDDHPYFGGGGGKAPAAILNQGQ